MKIYIGICIIGLFLAISACYEDKGNYSYSDINELTLKMNPAGGGVSGETYILAQSQLDSLFFDITPEVSQSVRHEDNNLTYQWIRAWSFGNKNYKDTIRTKTCTFKFPPKALMTYTVLFIVKDESNGLEVYKNVTVKTIVPYIRSWLIMHGQEGDRSIAALEYDTTRIKLTKKDLDIHQTLRGYKRFQKAFAMKYATDKLFIFQPDSCTWVFPFGMDQKGSTRTMMPGGWNAQVVDCISSINSRFGIISDAGKYYHNGAFGYFYEAEADLDAVGYHADKAYISNEDGYTTLWDDVHKKLLYYGSNWYNQMTDARQDLSEFDARIVNITPQELNDFDLSSCQLLWMGRGLTDLSKIGASALFKKLSTEEYYIVNVGLGGKGKSAFSVPFLKGKDEPSGFVTTDNMKLEGVDFDIHSSFASTGAFGNQLFYSKGTDVYIYNIITGESDFLYSVGTGKNITRLSFREDDPDNGNDKGNDRILGIVVQTADGQGEFHEIVLTTSGDVTYSASYGGFGPIVDVCYSYIPHNAYDL